MGENLNYTIGVTTTLTKEDKLRKGDYVYEIKDDSDLPFEKVFIVESVKKLTILKLVNICSGEVQTIDVSKDDLKNLQKIQLTDNVRKLLRIK